MGLVWLFEGFDLFGVELDRERGYGVVEMFRLADADEWRGDAGA